MNHNDSKIGSLIDPAVENRMIEALAPVIGDIYDTHMTSGPRRIAGEEDQVTGTLDPLNVLFYAAGMQPEERPTVALAERVYHSFQERVSWFRDRGVDLLGPVAIAGHMNLGTEDNIVHYHGEQLKTYGKHEAFEALLRRWTTEEFFHGPTLETWGVTAGALDRFLAHKIKIDLIMGGIHVDTDSLIAINAFTDPQEGDTADAHKNVGLIVDPIGRQVNNRLSGQEVRHKNMFRAIGKAIYSLDQEFVDYALAIEANVQWRFAMPAAQSYPNYVGVAKRIAAHGLFTIDGVLAQQRDRVNGLNLLELKATTDAAKKAQTTLAMAIDPTSRLNKLRQTQVEKETECIITEAKANGSVPFILGRTVVIENGVTTVVADAV